MKILITGDWQLDDRPPHDKINPTTQRSTRFDEGVEVIERVIDAGLAAGAQGMLHLGDLTEHKHPSPLEFTAAAHLFARVVDKGHFVWAIAGNHDGSLFKQTSSSIAFLSEVRKDQVKVFHDVEVDKELGMLAIPYIHTAKPEEIQALVKAALVKAALVKAYPGGPIGGKPLFTAAHYGGKGSIAGFDNKEIQGDFLAADQFCMDYAPQDHIFGGHIHKAQDFMLGGAHFWHPGSAVVQNIGERADGKQWILFDTVTRQVVRQNIPQPRKFIVVPYSPTMLDAFDTKPLWGPEDIVQLQGSYKSPDYPADTVEAGYKRGVPRPFSIDMKPVKTEREARAAGALEISTEGGIHEAVSSYVREKYPNLSGENNIIGPATSQLMDLLKEGEAKIYSPVIVPIEMEISQLLTVRKLKFTFVAGQPVLITGDNGIGKTNFGECMLWICDGETSKGVSLAGVVNRECDEGSGKLLFQGQDGEVYRITRSVKLAKGSGKPTHRLALDRAKPQEEWESLSDGGIADIQKLIDQLLGGSFQSIKTTAFKFQSKPTKGSDPFISAHPTERKAILGEILGLGPFYVAAKVLDTKRKESARKLADSKAQLAGRIAVGDDQEQRVATLKTDLEKVTADLEPQRAAVPIAKELLDKAQLDDTRARGEVQALQLQLDQLPNTAAAVSAADQELKTTAAAHETATAAQLKRSADLDAEIKQLEADLAGLHSPTPELVQTMEEVLEKNKVLLQGAQAASTAAQGKLQGAQAASTAAQVALGKVQLDLATTTAKLVALPPAGDLVRKKADLAALETIVFEKGEQIMEMTVSSNKLVTQISTTEEVLAKLKVDAASFDGKDIGNCARCGQAIDSSHIEKELARIKEESAAAEQQLAECELLRSKAVQVLGETILVKNSAVTQVTQLQADIRAEELAQQERSSLQATVADLESKRDMSAQELHDAAGVVTAALLEASQAQQGLATAQNLVDQLQKEADQVKALTAAVGTKTGQLQAKREELVKSTLAFDAANIAAGTAMVQLSLKLDQAKAADLQTLALAGTLRAQLGAKQSEAQGFATWLLTYSNNLNAATTAVALGEQREKDLQASLKAIEDQKAANAAALLELGMLEQRLAIDEMSCKLSVELPKHLVERYLPVLEDRMNLYIEKLGTGYLTITFTPFEDDKDALAIMISDGKPGRKVEIQGYSGSQLERVEYSSKFAVSDLVRQVRGVTFGLMFFDEPSGGLNVEGKKALIALLKERAEIYPVTMLISHDEALIRSFDRRLTFTQGANDETLVAG